MNSTHWKYHKIGHLVQIRRGASPRPIDDYVGYKGMPWVKISDATADKGRFVWSTALCIKEEGVPKSVVVNPGELIISNSATPGLPKIMKIKACIHDGWLKVDKYNGITRDFLYYSIKHHVKRLVIQGNGSIFTNLKTDILKDFPIPVPDSIEEQEQIAKVLSIIEDRIELNNKINAELESMAKLLYDYWFVQYDFPDENGKSYKSSGGKMVWNETLKRKIPFGWQVCELREFVTSNRGLSYNGKNITGGGVPMINLNSFNVDASYKPEGIKTYSGNYGRQKILRPFDLVMCNTQQTALDSKKDIIGKSFFVPDIFETDVVSSHHVTTITVEKENLKYYLNSLFNADYFHRYISGYATGTNILGLNFDGVLSFKTAIPIDNLLDSYKSMVVNIEKQKGCIIKESKTLMELRDWLLPILMNGQVTVE